MPRRLGREIKIVLVFAVFLIYSWVVFPPKIAIELTITMALAALIFVLGWLYHRSSEVVIAAGLFVLFSGCLLGRRIFGDNHPPTTHDYIVAATALSLATGPGLIIRGCIEWKRSRRQRD